MIMITGFFLHRKIYKGLDSLSRPHQPCCTIKTSRLDCDWIDESQAQLQLVLLVQNEEVA